MSGGSPKVRVGPAFRGSAVERFEIRRDTPDGRLEAVAEGGQITLPTLVKVLELIEAKTDYKAHVEIAVLTGALLTTLDNEEDALETIRRLEAAPPKKTKETSGETGAPR